MKLRRSKGLTYPAKKKLSLELLGGSDDYSASCFGFLRRDGKHYSGASFEKVNNITPPANIKKAYYSPSNGGLFVVADGKVYIKYKNSQKFYDIYNIGEGNLFFADARMNSCNATVVLCGKDRVVFNGSGESTLTDSHSFYTGVMHCGRFFAVDYNERLKLLWSSGGINDWKNNLDGCGYAYLTGDGGEILKLVNFDEKLIAVRCNGLSVIRAYGDPQNFKIDESSYYYTADGIIENTISVCDNKLIFCTESGIFAFDGNDVERQECDDSWDICAYQSAVSYGDRYLIMCSSKRLGKDVVYVYEPSEKLGYFIDFSPECIYAGDGVYAVKDSGLYCLSEGKACGVWKKSGVNFGLSSKKVLRSIAVECSNDIVVKVKSGTASKTYFGGGVKSVRLSGFEFDFEISGNGEAYSLVANAEVIDEV